MHKPRRQTLCPPRLIRKKTHWQAYWAHPQAQWTHPHTAATAVACILTGSRAPSDLASRRWISTPTTASALHRQDPDVHLAARSRIHVDRLNPPPLELVDLALNPLEPAAPTSGPRCWSARWLRCGPRRQSARHPSSGRAGVHRRGSDLAFRSVSTARARRAPQGERRSAALELRGRGEGRGCERRASRGERRCAALVHLVEKEEVARCAALVCVWVAWERKLNRKT